MIRRMKQQSDLLSELKRADENNDAARRNEIEKKIAAQSPQKDTVPSSVTDTIQRMKRQSSQREKLWQAQTPEQRKKVEKEIAKTTSPIPLSLSESGSRNPVDERTPQDILNEIEIEEQLMPDELGIGLDVYNEYKKVKNAYAIAKSVSEQNALNLYFVATNQKEKITNPFTDISDEKYINNLISVLDNYNVMHIGLPKDYPEDIRDWPELTEEEQTHLIGQLSTVDKLGFYRLYGETIAEALPFKKFFRRLFGFKD